MNNLKVLKLNTNTNVYLKKTKKFKSIAINIVYKMKYDYKNITAFNVLAKYLGNSSNQYPSIEKFNKHIDDLYGTSFGMKSEFVGNLFTFSIFANYVNPKFVSDNDLHENIIKLLHDCIYNPLIKENKFDEELFEEYVITRMRMKGGIDISDLKTKFGDFRLNQFTSNAEKYIKSGKIIKSDSHYALSEEGIMISDMIFVDLI